MKDKQCSAMVWSSGDWGRHQCSRKGVNKERGKWFCKQHTPSIVKAKADAQRAEWKKEYAAKEKERKRKDTMETDFPIAINLLREANRDIVTPLETHEKIEHFLRKCDKRYGREGEEKL